MSDQENLGGLETPSESEDLLVEIGCEELPPKALDGLREAFFAGVCTGLKKENITFNVEESEAYSSPRRLAILLRSVAARQPDQDNQRRGPAIAAAFDENGEPRPAALGFARSVGMPIDAMEKMETDKGSWLVARVHSKGKPLQELIIPILQEAVRQLPIPRPMRWSDHDFSFIRPVHWLLIMHGERVIPGELLGQSASDQTMGHRFHDPGPHRLSHASEYLSTLESHRVLADQNARSKRIRDQLLHADPLSSVDDSLLSEVCNLVEWPVAVKCSFDHAFLSVPHEALVASMQDHQKFFPVLADSNSFEVSNKFVVIANIESRDVDQVRDGFERVIRPRLADARFFLEQDQKLSLKFYLDGLDQITFQHKIGSVGDKSRRIAAISKVLAEDMGLDFQPFERAGRLAKSDLMTQMVGEFPELQGTMGKHYALYFGESEQVALAIEQHYLPRFAGDKIPSDIHGQIVGLADRADTLTAIFSAGLRPTGNKDPFALRRSSLGLVRILLEAGLSIAPKRLLEAAASQLASQGLDVDPSLVDDVMEFVQERIKSHFLDAGHAAELVNAALLSPWTELPDLRARLEALSGFLGTDSGLSLAAANKRIGNILRKTSFEDSVDLKEDSMILEEERLLFVEVSKAGNSLKPLLLNGNYRAALEQLSLLRPHVDQFFDNVMVMDEDPVSRNNRLGILSRLKSLFDQIADLSVLA